MQLFNLKLHKAKRRALRKKMTPAEVAFWKELRREKLGYKFRRQFGIGHYIIDFYCPRLKLAVELDGDIHTLETNKRKDEIRNKYLQNCGIIVKRYWNHQIFEDINSVVEELYYICKDLNDRNTKKQLSLRESPSKIRGRYRGS